MGGFCAGKMDGVLARGRSVALGRAAARCEPGRDWRIYAAAAKVGFCHRMTEQGAGRGLARFMVRAVYFGLTPHRAVLACRQWLAPATAPPHTLACLLREREATHRHCAAS